VPRADGPIVGGVELGRPGRMGRGPQDVLDLVGIGKRMEVRRAGRAQRCSGGLGGGRRVRVSGRSLGCPRGIAQPPPTPAASGEHGCRLDRIARPRVGRMRSLEYL
jgi:hypothetical protein